MKEAANYLNEAVTRARFAEQLRWLALANLRFAAYWSVG
jgi:hypothetical protein